MLQHRDPARRYEIYLMKDLTGFDRSRWKTGFTNYRYAIPEMAGRSGRAIYKTSPLGLSRYFSSLGKGRQGWVCSVV